MKTNRKLILLAAVVLFAAALVMWGPIGSNVEQAQYTVVESDGSIEIREYAPMIIAETQVSGDRMDAANDGFRAVADYIFGNNTADTKVAMTAPVIQESNKKIAMTAPVMQAEEEGIWTISFVMPSQYTMETLPKPNNDAVTLKEIPAQRFAVIRFRGTWQQANLDKHTEELLDFMVANDLTARSAPAYAFYNPPWTLPFLRRNEVMVEL